MGISRNTLGLANEKALGGKGAVGVAGGDICGPPWQVAKSVGEGCVAGMEAAAYARKLKQKGESDVRN